MAEPSRADLLARIAQLEGQVEHGFEVAEAAARRSALQYRHLFERAPVSIWEEDFSRVGQWFAELRAAGVRDFRAWLAEREDQVLEAASRVQIVRVNRAALDLLKLEDKSRLEGNFRDIFKSETRTVFVEELAAIWEGRTQITLEGTGRAADGSPFHYILNMLIPTEHGAPRLDTVIVVITDITELKEAQHALRRSEAALTRTLGEKQAVFTSIPDTVISVDPELRLLECNRPLQRLCPDAARLRPGQTVGGALTAGCPWAAVLRETLDTGRSVRRDKAECARCGASPRVFEITGSPLVDGQGRHLGAVAVVRDVTRLERLEQELIARRGRSGMGNIVGRSQAMQKVYGLIDQLAQVDSTVLITGESGTGKELVAEALHYGGARAKRPLVKVNCSALTENLLESELFGHVKGAFSGAISDKVGRFQAADGGTLFLDEIGDISTLIQLKLLRAIETKEYERVGESRPRRADVRIVTATNAHLLEKVRSGEFREDLYYRLKVVNIALPPLRERREDIPLLVEHFIEGFARSMHRNIEGVDEAVLALFMRHTWPGNIRELRHAVEHACILCPRGRIRPEHLPELASPAAPEAPPRRDAARITPDDVREALARAGGKRALAARLLGVSRATLYRRLDEFGIR
ncbi:MAG: sigma 54-interacting transcriptional regulator [Desulfovibrionaceae bacterium]